MNSTIMFSYVKCVAVTWLCQSNQNVDDDILSYEDVDQHISAKERGRNVLS